jgi:predicted ribosome quality control (RQC) complex YloA/Tae2 family protein
MKLKILIVLNLISVFVFSQEKTEQQLSNEIMKLKRTIQIQKEEISTLTKRNEEIEIKLNEISNNLDQKLNRNLELQAQNERAMNLALDEFTKKFEVQNQTVKGVQDQLDEKFSSQLIIFLVAVVILIIISVAMNKATMNKALKQNLASWNNFQEHILKK